MREYNAYSVKRTLCTESNTMDIATTEGDFYRLGCKHGTDKATYHGYHRFYPRFVEHLRGMDGAAIIEIGMDQLKSLNLWLEYFPKAFIYGVDIGVEKSGERYLIHKADQSDVSKLRELAGIIKAAGQKVVFINDDGSHVPQHVITTFNYFFRHVLEEGGVYAIEDIETSYWKNGYMYGYTVHCGFQHRESVIEIFKHLADDVNREYLSDHERRYQDVLAWQVPDEVRKMVSSVTFGQNCVIITKKTAEEYQYDGRPYKWPEYLR